MISSSDLEAEIAFTPDELTEAWDRWREERRERIAQDDWIAQVAAETVEMIVTRALGE